MPMVMMVMNEQVSARALGAERLTTGELGEALGADILALGMLASEVCRRQRAGRAGYRRVHAVSLASLSAGAAVPDTASELRLSVLPDTQDEAFDAVRRARAAAGPVRRVTGYAWSALNERAAAGWESLADLLAGLRQAGLTDLAEVEADRIDDLATTIRALRRAGLGGHRVTIATPLADRKIEVVEHVRAAHAGLGGISSFAPLPTHPAEDVPTTGYEDLRTVALTRLAFGHLAPHETPAIEVDWLLYGPKLAQVALTFGADVLDAVPATDDEALGHRRSAVADVERNIRAAGFEPEERDRQVRA